MNALRQRARAYKFIVAGANDLAFNEAMNNKTASNSALIDAAEPVSHEECLTKIARDQDRAAFLTIFEYFAPRLKSFMLGKAGTSPQMAEEIVQEAMLSVWRKAGSFNADKASASTWIFTIARNKRIDMLRKANRPEYDPLDPLLTPDHDPAPLEAITHEQNAGILKVAISALPEQQSFLIKKAFYEDKSHHAIAEELQIPLGTVKSRIRLGMERLRHSLRNKITQESLS